MRVQFRQFIAEYTVLFVLIDKLKIEIAFDCPEIFCQIDFIFKTFIVAYVYDVF